jgi:DNA replication protein DnaC
MAAALDEQMQMNSLDDMGFEERLGLLLDREIAVRQTRRMNTRLRKARLRQDSCIEDIDFRHPRGLDKSLVMRLAGCDWIKAHNNLIITGPTGVGKTYLACAFAQKACREGFNTIYLRLSKLFEDLSLSKGDGRYLKLLSSFAKADLLVLDDYGLEQLGREQRHDLLEILEDRHGLKSTLVTSQLPVQNWHEQIGDPTLADAILDRLVHSAHQIKLNGESMRKKNANLT